MHIWYDDNVCLLTMIFYIILIVTYSEEDRDACLDAFDHCYDLMLKINPRFAKTKFEDTFKFPNGDPLTGNLLFQPSEIQMEVLLVYARDAIVVRGVIEFFELVVMLCSQEPYKQIGISLLGILIMYYWDTSCISL